jgi:tRNA nucleotidyltransferase (CCA-adding enzyme)
VARAEFARIACVTTGGTALEALRAAPCGAHALAVLGGFDDAWVVGGAVRDALLGRVPVEIDVVAEHDAAAVAVALGRVTAVSERFGTYAVDGGVCAYDVVRARRESYAVPGALPDVEAAALDDDLARRDFSVNAIALSARGELRSVPGALEDLGARRLRALHEASFVDDPTRLWRLARYAARLGFLPEPETLRWAVQAVRDGALETVSGDRLGAELRLALAEPDPLAVLHAVQNLGVVSGLRLQPGVAVDALALLPPGAREDLTLLGAVIPDGDWPAPYGFTAAERAVLGRCAELEPLRPGAPSEIVARLRGEPVEAVAVAGARGDPAIALRYLSEWRAVRLAIDGHDLLAAGIPEGPELGRRLERALALRLDGRLGPGREAELAAALGPA